MTPEGTGSRTRKCFLNVYLNVFSAACSPERTLLALPTILNLVCPNFEKSSTKTQFGQGGLQGQNRVFPVKFFSQCGVVSPCNISRFGTQAYET